MNHQLKFLHFCQTFPICRSGKQQKNSKVFEQKGNCRLLSSIRAELSQAESSWVKLSQAESSRIKPSQVGWPSSDFLAPYQKQNN